MLMRIGVDLGSANIRAFTESKKIVFSSPSVVAYDSHTKKPVAMGKAALNMTGRTPDSIEIINPLKDGVIYNYDATVQMIKFFLGKISGMGVLKDDIMAAVPSTMTQLEKMAVMDAFSDAGAGRICLISGSMAAALGSGISMKEPRGTMFVDIGAGSVDSAVVTMGDIAVSESVKTGSDDVTADIIKYLKRERDIDVGWLTADDIKKKIAGAVKRNEAVALIAKGKNAISQTPISFEITSTEIYFAVKDRVDSLLNSVRKVFSVTPPELTADIFDTGIVLTGGGALLYGIDEYIEKSTGVKTTIADDAENCVIRGVGNALKDLKYLRKNGYIFKSGETD